VDIPLEGIIRILTKTDLQALAKLHDVWIPARLGVDESRKMFENHRCSGCSTVVSVFKNIFTDSAGQTDETVKPPGKSTRYAKPRKIAPTCAKAAYDALVKKRSVYK
jgi:hypothetical protein